MEYISLYRKYRPKNFSEMIGQDVITTILKNSIVNNKISHAYIFSGPRGTGKTSLAKIFSKAVNCLNFKNDDLCGNCSVCTSNFDDEIDIVEIDAASNNGVDEIREIRNNVKLMPSHLKYKVYIIDEVHMLSTSAFNALLKTLEEPPKHVIFILATTEINKIPITVLSRCQKFDFKKISQENLEKQLNYILKKENKNLNNKVISLIAKMSDGGLRDAINTLDQILSLNNVNVSENDVYNLIGDVNEDTIFELFDSIVNFDIKSTLLLLNRIYDEGKNYINTCDRLQLLIRNVIIYNSTNNFFDSTYEQKIKKYTRIDLDKCSDIELDLLNLTNELKHSNNQKTLMEIYFIKMCLKFKKNLLIKEDTVIQKNEEKVEQIEDTKIKNEMFDKNKKIRINNVLFGADKELKKEILNQISKIKEYISVKEYNSIANLVSKGSIEVASENYLLFTFKNKFEIVLFEKNIEDIEKFLKIIFNKKFNVVAISEEEWLIEKNKYIENIKKGIKYEYIEEIKIKKTKKNTALQNAVEDIFGNGFITEE